MSSKEKKEKHKRHMHLHLWCVVAIALFIAMIVLYAFPVKLSHRVRLRKIKEAKEYRTFVASVNSTAALVDELGLKQRPSFIPLTEREHEEQQKQQRAIEQKELKEKQEKWIYCKSCDKKTDSYKVSRGHSRICMDCDRCKRCKKHIGDKHNPNNRKRYAKKR